MPDDDLPVMSLWTQKLFGSSRFAACHGHAQGAYALLLMREHGFKGRGLPSDDASLARLAGLDFADWSRVRDEVLQFFEERAGRLYNSTCEEQIEAAREAKAAAKAKAEAAARARWGGRPDARSNAQAYPQALLEECPPSPSPSDGKPPPTPSRIPRSDDPEPEEERPSACGEVLFSLTDKKGEWRWRKRQAQRLLEKWPELTEADLEAWLKLRTRRPDVFAKVETPKAWTHSLLWKYGTVETAGYAGPPRQTPEEAREAALTRRSEETLREIHQRPPGVDPRAVGIDLAAELRKRKEALAGRKT